MYLIGVVFNIVNFKQVLSKYYIKSHLFYYNYNYYFCPGHSLIQWLNKEISTIIMLSCVNCDQLTLESTCT